MRTFCLVLLAQGALGGNLLTIIETRSRAACCEDAKTLTCNAVKIHPSVLETHETLNLPGGLTLTFEGNINGDPNSYSYGDDKGSDAVITYNPVSGGLNGHAMTAEGRSFAIENCGAQGHVWKEIDIANLPENNDFSDDHHANSSSSLDNLTAVSDTSTIVTFSVKIYYTARFAAKTPDINGFVDMVLAVTNKGYENSNVPLRVKKHCMEQTTIRDGYSGSELLRQFSALKPTPAQIRGTADMAALFVDYFYPDLCGIGWLDQIGTGNTLSVTAKACAQGGYTFGHELGHNIGLHHNRETGANNPGHSFGYGHLIKRGVASTGYRTIMAYYAPGHHQQVNYYSNPRIYYPVTRTQTGVHLRADNAWVLVQQRFKLAAVGDESNSCRGCNGNSNAWTCCSSANKCGEGEGDCDSDSDCKAGLQCGEDNCQKYHPGVAQASADCCFKGCNGDGNSWTCCTANQPCKLGDGDCDSDSECQGRLKCGNDNCRSFHPGAEATADCCYDAGNDKCNGGNEAWDCCTTTNPCAVGQGDCDRDSECQAGLVCGNDNCRAFHPGAGNTADCCVKDTKGCDGTDWNCCSGANQCGHGEGDCDSDNDCRAGLRCGNDNCRQFNSQAPPTADCCTN